MNPDEGLDAAIRIRAADDGENGKQQHMPQLVELALGATRIGNCREQREKMFE